MLFIELSVDLLSFRIDLQIVPITSFSKTNIPSLAGSKLDRLWKTREKEGGKEECYY